MRYVKRLSRQLWILIALVALGVNTAKAEDHSVGLVIDFGDGQVITRAVSFSEDELTGLQVLERAGLAMETFTSPGVGSAVCAIEDVGCPASNCFCHSPPNYWSYWHLVDGTWQYSPIAASAWRVHHGDVEGWSWGPGEPPPVFSFQEIVAPTFTPTPEPSSTPLPTATPVPTNTPPPTATPTPNATNTPLPTHTHTVPPRTTPVPTNTPQPTVPPTATPVPPEPTEVSSQSYPGSGDSGSKGYPGAATSTPRPTATPRPSHTPTPRPTNTRLRPRKTYTKTTPFPTKTRRRIVTPTNTSRVLVLTATLPVSKQGTEALTPVPTVTIDSGLPTSESKPSAIATAVELEALAAKGTPDQVAAMIATGVAKERGKARAATEPQRQASRGYGAFVTISAFLIACGVYVILLKRQRQARHDR